MEIYYQVIYIGRFRGFENRPRKKTSRDNHQPSIEKWDVENVESICLVAQVDIRKGFAQVFAQIDWSNCSCFLFKTSRYSSKSNAGRCKVVLGVKFPCMIHPLAPNSE